MSPTTATSRPRETRSTVGWSRSWNGIPTSGWHSRRCISSTSTRRIRRDPPPCSGRRSPRLPFRLPERAAPPRRPAERATFMDWGRGPTGAAEAGVGGLRPGRAPFWVRAPFRAPLFSIPAGRGYGRENGAEERVEGLSLDPAHDHHEIVVPVDIDDVGAVAPEGHAIGGRRGQVLSLGIEVPVGESVAGIGRPGCPGKGDPLFRDDLSAGPTAVLKEQVARAGQVPGVDEQAAAIMAAAGHGLDAPPVELDPRVGVA